MNVIINDDCLKMDEIDGFKSKVRAILIDEENRVLVANYNQVILLPGGSVEEDENIECAITRELKEETGEIYNETDLTLFTQIDFFQKDYPKRDGMVQNRLLRTFYFIGDYKGVDLELQQLTENEKDNNFGLALIPLSELENVILENQNDNPRNVYFQREMLEVLKVYNQRYEKTFIKTLK